VLRKSKLWAVLACAALMLTVAGLREWIWPSESIRRSREAVLRYNLFAMRDLLQQYYIDTKRRPHSLDELVKSGYIKQIPTDPITGRRDTWMLERSKGPETGIVNIRSGSHRRSSDGTTYDMW